MKISKLILDIKNATTESLKNSILYFDIEVAPNLCLIGFRFNSNFYLLKLESSLDSNSNFSRMQEIKTLIFLCKERDIILCGYNIKHYDLPILSQFFRTYAVDTNRIYQISTSIVEKKEFIVISNDLKVNLLYIDLKDCYAEYLGKTFATISLKKIALVEGLSGVLTKLPFDPHQPILEDKIKSVLDYLKSDLIAVAQIGDRCIPSWINTRKEFKILFSELNWAEILRKTQSDLSEFVMRSFCTSKRADKKITELHFDDLHLLSKNCKILSDYKKCFGDINLLTDKILLDVIERDGISAKPGLGGLHSQNTKQFHLATSEVVLLELDMASYYPFLLLLLLKDNCPSPVSELKDVLNKFLNRRLELKKLGERSKEKVYKIILNSIIGRFNYKKSYFFAPKLNYSITINGQLFIWEIILRLRALGAEILLLNTDGFILCCSKTLLNQVQICLKDFETKFQLVFGTNKELLAVGIGHVNKYVKWYKDQKKVETKGITSFGDATIYKRFFSLCDARSFLEKKELTFLEMKDFMVDQLSKTPKDFIYVNNYKDLSENVPARFVLSKNPDYYNGFASCDQDSGKRLGVLGKNKNITLISDANIAKLSNIVDPISYALDLYNICEELGLPVKPIVESDLCTLENGTHLIKKALLLATAGIYLEPYGETSFTKLNRDLNTESANTFIQESFSKNIKFWGVASGLAAVCIKHVVVVKIKSHLLLEVKSANHDHPVVNWFANAFLKEKRGIVALALKPDVQLNTTDIFGSGAYCDLESYAIFLCEVRGLVANTVKCQSKDLEITVADLSKAKKKQMSFVIEGFSKKNWNMRTFIACKKNPSLFVLDDQALSIFSKPTQEATTEVTAEVTTLVTTEDVYDSNLVAPLELEPTRLDSDKFTVSQENLPDFNTLLPGNYLMISPPGSGKTYNALKSAIKISKTGKVAVLAFPTQKLLFQSEKLLQLMLETESDQFNVCIMIKEKMPVDVKEIAKMFLGKNTIHFTLHAYIRSIGHAPKLADYTVLLLHYAKNIWFFLDEVHLFLDYTIIQLPYKRAIMYKQNYISVIRALGEFFLEGVVDLELTRGEANPIQRHPGVWELDDQIKNINKQTYKIELSGTSFELSSTCRATNLFLEKSNFNLSKVCEDFINEKLAALKTRLAEEKSCVKGDLSINVQMWVDFLISVSYSPTIIENVVYSDSMERALTWEEFYTYIKNSRDKTNGRDKTKFGKLYYSFEPPFKANLVLLPVLSLHILSQFSSSILVTAGLSQFHQDLLFTYVKNLKQQSFLPNNQMLDEVVILFSDSQWFRHFNVNFWRNTVMLTKGAPFYTLGFQPSFKYAKAFFEFCRIYSIPVGLISGDCARSVSENVPGEFNNIYSEEFGSNDIRFHVGSSFGLIGTGINLPNRKLLFVNTSIFKPISAYWYNQKPEILKSLQEDEILTTIRQNMGRFARRTQEETQDLSLKAKRVIFVLGVSSELDYLKDYITKVANEMFLSTNVIDLNAVEWSFSTRKSNKPANQSVWDVRLEAIKAAVKFLKFKDSTFDLILENLKSKKTILKEEICNMVLQHKNSNLTWKMVCTKFNLYRLKGEEKALREDLHEYFNSITRQSGDEQK